LGSVHGPVTHVNKDEGYAVAYRLSAHGQVHTGVQYMNMLRARNLEQLDLAMAPLQVCHFNQVAADTAGKIRYLYGGRVPIRPEGADFARVLDGSTSATLWDSDSVVPLMDMPQVYSPACGFVQNCNNSPQTTTDTVADPDPETYPPGAVRGGRTDTVRAWYLRKQLAGEELLSVDDAREIATDSYMIPHGPMSRLLAYCWEKYGAAYGDRDRIEDSVEGILSWDGRPLVHSPVPTIFTLWLWKSFNEKVALPVSLMEKPLSTVDEVFAMKLFNGMLEAQDELQSMVPLPSVPWGMMHIIRRDDRVWPVETGMYPAISLMNANLVPKGRKLEDLNCVVGSAYVGFHVMDEDGIRSESIMPLGQTDRLDLPYVDAMTDLFALRELKPLPFTDEELAEVETTETILTLPALEDRSR
ncbi:MAG: penicillin acylase family protein, partial [Phycisphaerales bacterium]|nr:penicillin acylase family protein [Phycisphaerales bacterium]